ncbi:MAG: ribose 5-phosphate isomerase A [Nitrososphaeria archaeon]
MLNLANELLEEINASTNVGIGSGRTISSLIEALSTLNVNNKIKFIPSSSQILLKLQEKGFEINSFPDLNQIELYIDSVDQLESNSLYMIKGGGGALLKEKILMYNAAKILIILQENKLTRSLGTNCPVPIEISQISKPFLCHFLRTIGGSPSIRRDLREFPVYTENGNMILDVKFDKIDDPPELEQKIKLQPGVIEVGLFTKRPTSVYLIKDNSFEKLTPSIPR